MECIGRDLEEKEGWLTGGGGDWTGEDPYKIGFGLEMHRVYIVGGLR